MNLARNNAMARWALVAAALMAAAVPTGIVWTLSLYGSVDKLVHSPAMKNPESQMYKDTADAIAALKWDIGLEWVAVGIVAAGAVLALLVALRRPVTEWLKVAAVAPVVYLLLAATPQAVSGDWLPLLRMVLALGAVAAYLPVVLRLSSRLQYGVCCSALGVAAVFFYQWEPPPPKPVPIAKPLAALPENLLVKLNAPREKPVPWSNWKWTGKTATLPPDVEKVLGVDEYLQLTLEPSRGPYRMVVFVTYNANAKSLVAHVPWVCMVEAGFELTESRQDEVAIRAISDREINPNVVLFERSEGPSRQKALVFQYFNVGGTYCYTREMARILANMGAIGRTGSFISQTQIIVWLPPQDPETPMSKNSTAYALGIEMLNFLVPLLEREHYPDLRAAAGG